MAKAKKKAKPAKKKKAAKPAKAAKAKAKAAKAKPAKAKPAKAKAAKPKAAKPKLASGTGAHEATSEAAGDRAHEVASEASNGANGSHAATVEAYVKFIFDGIFPDVEGDYHQIDPNEWDMDPSPFYTTLDAVFGVADPNQMAFEGYGGKVGETIAFIVSRWKGGELPPMTSDGIPWDGGGGD